MKSQLTGKDPDAGKDGRQNEKPGTRMRRLGAITEAVDMNLADSRRRWRTGRPGALPSKASQSVRHDLATGQLEGSDLISFFYR